MKIEGSTSKVELRLAAGDPSFSLWLEPIRSGSFLSGSIAIAGAYGSGNSTFDLLFLFPSPPLTNGSAPC